MTVEKNWYAIYTKPRAEKKTNERLLSFGVETYFPLTKVIRQWSDRKKMVELPLFSSYLFVKIGLREYETVRRVDGVVNFVYYLNKPAKIREKEIKAIEDFLGKTEHNSIEFMPLDEVRITSGILVGKNGIIQKIGKNKVILLIGELGTVIKAELSKSILEKK
ncbi:MAG: UpxY family transcription antiterminator [Bacteroidales bacterium]|nr:UpxY family transcription antiterminator [Bacteroidales bacterium]